jgi:microcystin-dependent protein
MDTVFLGSIVLLPFNFVPAGFHACDGTLLSIAENMALYSLVGTTFGGDGRTTFALPDLNKKDNPVLQDGKLKYCIALDGIYPSRV